MSSAFRLVSCGKSTRRIHEALSVFLISVHVPIDFVGNSCAHEQLPALKGSLYSSVNEKKVIQTVKRT